MRPGGTPTWRSDRAGSPLAAIVRVPLITLAGTAGESVRGLKKKARNVRASLPRRGEAGHRFERPGSHKKQTPALPGGKAGAAPFGPHFFWGEPGRGRQW